MTENISRELPSRAMAALIVVQQALPEASSEMLAPVTVALRTLGMNDADNP